MNAFDRKYLFIIWRELGWRAAARCLRRWWRNERRRRSKNA